MHRTSIRHKKEGPVTSIRMTREYSGLPVHEVHAFFVDGFLNDMGFIQGRDRFPRPYDTLHPETIVSTHHHEDHTGSSFWATKRCALLLIAHSKTSIYMKNPSQWVPRFALGCPSPSGTGEVVTE
jgi:glyoxylase-like metal-dependent hydrolase (beta-lactamase superfamily II)